MWSEEIDKKLREASENPAHSYDEKSWDKMEQLLDKHLPRKRKRGGIIFLLCFLLISGTAAFYIVQQQGSAKTTKIDKTVASQPIDLSTSTEPGNAQTPGITVPAATAPGKQDAASRHQEPVLEETGRSTAAKKKRTTDPFARRHDQPVTTDRKDREQKAEAQHNTMPAGKNNNQDILADPFAASVNGSVAGHLPVSPSPVRKDTAAAVAKNDSFDQQLATKENKKPGQAPPLRGNKVSVNFSFGPDISGLGMNYTGRLKLQAGVGLSYAFSKRLTVRTGFFVSRKIYSADSAEYHPPPNFWSYYPNLKKVEANCLVYEIPVSLVYNFAAGKKGNWFASGGVSSYLMKKEDYGFSYKDSWGAPQYHHLSFDNKNHHFFSVLNLSAGYQYNFTDRLSLMAEPYAKIPLTGVGFGKVKLNSGGVLFTVGFKPFLKRK